MSEGFLPWWWGALAIGGIAVVYPFFSGRLLGVSSLYASLWAKRTAPLSELERALMAETEAEFGSQAPPAGTPTLQEDVARARAAAEGFRPLFLVGMVLGPALFALLASDFRLSFTLGQDFDARYGSFGVVPSAVLVLSGVLIGFGTRLGGGCTSGHGISGLARGQKGSIVTTAAFWGTALAVAWIFFLFGKR